MIEGQLIKTYIKPWTDGRSGKEVKLYSFKIKEYPDEFFRTGQKNPGVKEGSVIRFEADDKNNVRPEDIEIVSTGPQPTAAHTASSHAAETSQHGSLTKDGYWDRKEAGDTARQHAITYQAARKDAIELCGYLASHNALVLPTATKDRYTAFIGAVDYFTMRFSKDTERLQPLQEESEDAPSQPAKKRGRPAKAAEEDTTGELDLG